jgi:hypothetical protein
MLERAANEGHTLLPRADVVRQIRNLDLDPACPVDGDLFEAIAESLKPVICGCDLKDGSPAYQLDRLANVGEVIRFSFSPVSRTLVPVLRPTHRFSSACALALLADLGFVGGDGRRAPGRPGGPPPPPIFCHNLRQKRRWRRGATPRLLRP